MADHGERAWQTPGEHFSELFKLLVSHRGLSAERELLDVLGELRLAALYDGDEPRFGEMREIVRILQVPWCVFEVVEQARFPDLEISIAEVLYCAKSLSATDRRALAEKISVLAVEAASPPRSDAPLPETLLAALRKNGH